jgi:PAS domain S-box-containing protein
MADGETAESPARLPPNEAERLQALHAYGILDTPPEEALDELARLASWICGAPIALVTLVDAEREWFKARVGWDAPETARDIAFGSHAILADGPFVVKDARTDGRFSANPLVTGAPFVRFYAGAPLRTPEGHVLGTLCVLDREPRDLDARQRAALSTLGRQVMTRLELHRALRETVQAIEERSASQTELLRQTVTLRAVLQSMGEGIVVVGPDGSLRLLNRAAEAMLGLGVVDAPHAEWPERYHLFLPDGLTPFPAEQLPVVRALRGEHVDNVELCVRAAGQPPRWVSSTARPLQGGSAGPQGGIAVFRDVTARRLTDSLLRAQHAVSRILADADSLAVASTPLLQDIAEYLGWDLGELWEIDAWADVLRPSACWHRDDPRLQAVAQAGRGITYARGESLPGRAWEQGEPLFAAVGMPDTLRRGAAGALAGLKSAIAFPVGSGPRLLGVIVFWSREPQAADPDLANALAGLGAQIGQFMARRQAERALRTSEERLRTLFQRTPYPAFIHDEASQRILAVNDAALDAYGFSRDELLALTLRDLRVEPGDPAAPSPRHRRKDGTVLEVDESAQSLEIEGRPARCVFVRDLTEQRRSEGEMAERLAVSGLGAAVSTSLTWGGTLHRKVQDCAQAMVDHLGLELAGVWRRSSTDPALDLLGATVRDGTLPASQSRVPVNGHWLGTVAEARTPHWLDLAEDTTPPELLWTHRSGMRYLAGYPLLVEERSLGVLALGSSRPLSQVALEAVPPLADEIALHLEREEVRSALTASEARHRAVLENMLGGLLVVDERGFIETANAEAERIFGFARDQLLGQHLSLLMPLSMGPDYQATLREAFKKAISRITEWEGRRRNGELFPFELAMYQFETPAGKRYGGHIRDLSERREVERLKKEFVAVVSHELRTPLTSIRGSLSLLAGGALGELPDEAREVVAIADRNTVRLIHLINDILDLERLEAGRMPMYVSLHPLHGVCERAVEAVRAMGDLQGVRIDNLPTGAHVLADADRLVQVLVNLLSNAVKFSPRGSAVTVSAHEEGGWVEVRVQDHGRGIPQSHRDAIFQRFQQVESSDGRQKGGTGLGLPICKAIVEQLGGSMGVASEMGQGSTFWFRLRSGRPEANDDSLLAALADGLPPDARDVLLLDEDEALLGVVGRQLLSAGIPVRTARTVRQGVEQARARPPALLMLDVRFPDGDGFDVVRALAEDEKLRATPLLVYTSRDLGEGERARLRLGTSRFLTKSQATEQDVLDAVRELRDAREST